MSRIIVFGATGYTGGLTARSLVRDGARPTLVARSPERVQALADELGGLEWAVADVAEPATLRAAVTRGDVLVSTVGPFLEYGVPAVRTAAEVGAHYLDSTGEGPFIRQVFETWGPKAETTGAALLPAFGFDYVPGTFAGALAIEEAGPTATRVDIGYFPSGFGASGGTRASAARVLVEDGYTYRGGRIQRETPGRHVLRFDVHDRPRTAVSIPAAEQFGLPAAYPQLQHVTVGLGAPAAAALTATAISRLVLPALRIPAIRRAAVTAAERTLKGSTGGPSADDRATSTSTVVAVARDIDGRQLASVTLRGPDPYEFTANVLAWGAVALADGRAREAGALGPIGAFTLAGLEDACAQAGLIPVNPRGSTSS